MSEQEAGRWESAETGSRQIDLGPRAWAPQQENPAALQLRAQPSRALPRSGLVQGSQAGREVPVAVL